MAPAIDDQIFSKIEDFAGELSELKHLLYVLTDRVEKSFDPDRTPQSEFFVTLKFSPESLEATRFLVGQCWARSHGLHEKMISFLDDDVRREMPVAQAA